MRARLKLHAQNAEKRFAEPWHGLSPSQRLFQRVTALSVVLLLVNSVNLTQANYDTGGIYFDAYDDLAIEEPTGMVADDEGYLTKITPLEGQARYLNRGKETVNHEVQPGDTLSVIAYKYDLSMETILWANSGLGNGNYLKVGQAIKIPPADGVTVKVGKGDNWDKLIGKYKTKISKEELIAWNGSDTVVEGKEVFVLGGRKAVEYVATAKGGGRGAKSVPGRNGIIPEAPSIISVPGGWVRPTVGSLTQGYRWGHYAFDIADRSQPAIVAVRAGTVVEAYNDNGWHGGYGNFVLIDHGDGYKTLYAHNAEVYVSPGEYVGQGQVIAKMGNTGRVYGATGIHLHFELHYNGKKLNPSPVFGW
mgnify:CR=1 FL=1